MKYRTPAYRFTPYHTWYGYTAPAIMVDADTYEQGLKIATNKCTLVKNYPDKWKIK